MTDKEYNLASAKASLLDAEIKLREATRKLECEIARLKAEQEREISTLRSNVESAQVALKRAKDYVSFQAAQLEKTFDS